MNSGRTEEVAASTTVANKGKKRRAGVPLPSTMCDVFGASSCGGGYRMLEDVLASIYAGSWMRFSEKTPFYEVG